MKHVVKALLGIACLLLGNTYFIFGAIAATGAPEEAFFSLITILMQIFGLALCVSAFIESKKSD